MAIVNLLGGINFPEPVRWQSGPITYDARSMDISTSKYGITFEVPRSGTLYGFEFALTSVPQAPANGLKLSFHNVDPGGTSFPDLTTDLAYRVVTGITANSWVTSGIMTDDGTDTGTPLTVARGQRIYCVVRWASFQTGDSLVISSQSTGSAGANCSTWHTSYVSGNWSNVSTTVPIVALKYTDGTYPQLPDGVHPQLPGSYVSTAISTTTSPDEIGITFSFPTDVLIGGAWARVDMDGAGEFCLYGPDDVLITSRTIVQPHRSSTSSMIRRSYFDADHLLKANEVYRLTLKPTTTTAITINSFSVPVAEMLDLLAGGGRWQLTQREDGGTFSEPGLKRPWMGVWVTGIDQEIGGQPSTGFTGTE